MDGAEQLGERAVMKGGNMLFLRLSYAAIGDSSRNLFFKKQNNINILLIL